MEIEKGVLKKVDNLRDIWLGEFKFPEGVTSIENYAFCDCKNLKKIIIPECITSIGTNAFQYCDSITEIIIPKGVTNIGQEAFSGCGSLEEITIPDSVTAIEVATFEKCVSLKKITIPDSVTSIGDSAFAECESLKEMTIPNSVTEIGWSAFEGCINLEEITIPKGIKCIKPNAFEQNTFIKFEDDVSLELKENLYIQYNNVETRKIFPHGFDKIKEKANYIFGDDQNDDGYQVRKHLVELLGCHAGARYEQVQYVQTAEEY